MISKELFKKPNILLEDGPTRPARQSAPQDLYIACPECKELLLREELPQSGYVCHRCGAQLALSPRQRVAWLTDSFEEWDAELTSADRLRFPDYQRKLDKARQDTGEREGVLTGRAVIGGHACALFVMDAGFIMGSMGAAVGEKITRLFEKATELSLPVIGYTVSGGARIQEGIFSLMQMAKTSGAVMRHSDAGLLYAAVLTHPTTGGVVASFAMEADVILAEPKALIGFAGPRVIEQTMRQKLPEGFQRSEFLLEKGFVDRIVPRSAQKSELTRLLELHTKEAG